MLQVSQNIIKNQRSEVSFINGFVFLLQISFHFIIWAARTFIKPGVKLFLPRCSYSLDFSTRMSYTVFVREAPVHSFVFLLHFIKKEVLQ